MLFYTIFNTIFYTIFYSIYMYIYTHTHTHMELRFRDIKWLFFLRSQNPDIAELASITLLFLLLLK